VEVQTQHIEMQPTWRALIDERLQRLAERYPRVIRVHVTPRHGGHHLRGLEEVTVAATYPGATLRAAKQEEEMRAALDELERETPDLGRSFPMIGNRGGSSPRLRGALALPRSGRTLATEPGMSPSGTQLPVAIVRQLERAADAVRRNDLEIAIHHTGNALLMLKEAQSPRPAKRRRLGSPAQLRRVK
jgi:ribosome-associated translation inhibitor RaiA